MYLQAAADAIRSHVPEGSIPEGDADALFLSYAVLLRSKGSAVSSSDVHDAWAAWKANTEPAHEALVPFDELSTDTAEQDEVFVQAIRQAWLEVDDPGSSTRFHRVLFPSGAPTTDDQLRQATELYRVMVDSSEALVARRQGVNTFFLTMNGALLTAIGLIVQNADDTHLGALAVLVLAAAGALLALAWRSLIVSFGQLNAGKFKVINAIEKHLPVSIYDAEWEALERGENPDVYRSFTSREIWVPNALTIVHVIVGIVCVLFVTGLLTTDEDVR
jgi:hypothetical protein